jgi:hypothetical protein
MVARVGQDLFNLDLATSLLDILALLQDAMLVAV